MKAKCEKHGEFEIAWSDITPVCQKCLSELLERLENDRE